MERRDCAKKVLRTRNAKAAAKNGTFTKSRRNVARKTTGTKKNSGGFRPAQLASPRGIPSAGIGIDPTLVGIIQQHFHALIRRRIAEDRLRLPDELPQLNAVRQDRCWFPVPGMYGGFAYQWDTSSTKLRLVVQSWSRVVEGSGQCHHITAKGSRLVDDGVV